MTNTMLNTFYAYGQYMAVSTNPAF